MKPLLLILLAFAVSAGAQQAAKAEASPAAPPAVQANPDDVKSIDAIIHALYDVISGPAGQPRNWDRMRSLFHPGARLIPTGKRPNDPQTGARIFTVEDYIQRTTPLFEKDGFFETGIASRTEQFGNIAHVFSTYESRHARGEKPFNRGINSIQLFHDGSRWWVMTVLWDNETAEKPIPKKYLKSAPAK